MTTTIDGISAHEILDSRGNPTLSVTVRLKGGALGTATDRVLQRERKKHRDAGHAHYFMRPLLRFVRFHVARALAVFVPQRGVQNARSRGDTRKALVL
jgi:hypothetical protein